MSSARSYVGRPGVAGVRGAETAVLGFEHVGRVGEAVRGEQRSERAGARGLPREEALTHAAVVREHEARGLLARVAERMHGVVGAERQRARGGCDRRERSDRARDRGSRGLRAGRGRPTLFTRAAVSMPTTIALMRSRPERRAAVLAGRERGAQRDRAVVAAGADVVELERVTGGRR